MIVEGTYSGTLDGVPFLDTKEIDLGGGVDTATIYPNGYMDAIDGGEGDDLLKGLRGNDRSRDRKHIHSSRMQPVFFPGIQRKVSRFDPESP